jgi:integrase/recombinase XerD
MNRPTNEEFSSTALQGVESVQKLKAYIASIDTLPARGGKVHISAVAESAGIDRQVLYKNPVARQLLEEAVSVKGLRGIVAREASGEAAMNSPYRRFLALQSELADERTRRNERPTFTDAIEDLLSHMRSERGLSLNYQTSNLRSLKNFSTWISNTYPEKNPQTTLTRDLAEYLAAEQARGLAPGSIKLITTALKVLFAFLKSRGVIKKDPAKALRLPKLPRHLPSVLSKPEITRLLSVNLAGRPFPFRDQAVLELLCASGLRVAELANARLEHLDLGNRTLRIVGKGNKWRIVPFHPSCSEALVDYLENERTHLRGASGSDAFLFLSRRGKPLTTVRLWQIVKELGALAGLQTAVTHTSYGTPLPLIWSKTERTSALFRRFWDTPILEPHKSMCTSIGPASRQTTNSSTPERNEKGPSDHPVRPIPGSGAKRLATDSCCL